jgi:3-oxoacyl-[acyl-carrier protein] reductase
MERLESMIKRVLLTGDSRGVGKAIAEALLASGYSVVGCSRSNSSSTEDFKKKFPNLYTHINFDLGDTEGIKDFYLHTLKAVGPFHGFVNNAALAYDDLCTNANLERLEQMYKVNVLSPIMLTKYMIRDMLLNRSEGSIIHISSISAHTGYKGLSMYASTKGALEAFSKNVAREWGEKKIRSNVVCPGFMETEMSSTLTSELRNRIFARTSLKIPTSTDSVAHTVKFILSDESRSITGQVINVDSGTI